MSRLSDGELLNRADVRLCHLCLWSNFEGLGFLLEKTERLPHRIVGVDSNSPASVGGLKILDVILAVNNEDVAMVDFYYLRNLIQESLEKYDRIELLVVEEKNYKLLKDRNIPITINKAVVIYAPPTMPIDYLNFPKFIPRTCKIRLTKSDTSFGFELVSGENEIGAYVQEVFPNTPASNTPLRKCDRIIEIDGQYVDKASHESILLLLYQATKKGAVKLYVVDTETYAHAELQNISLLSTQSRSIESLKSSPIYSSDMNKQTRKFQKVENRNNSGSSNGSIFLTFEESTVY